MSREWKPGDVAVTQFGRSVVVSGQRCDHYDSMPHWHHVAHGGWDPLDTHPNARPLVVIDPEDREAVERLRVALLSTGRPGGIAALGQHETVQAALREYANPTPPKPDEPQGLGAVVEDEDGALWLRTTSPENDRDHLNKPWLSGVIRGHWQAVAAVRVLSPGVEVDQ